MKSIDEAQFSKTNTKLFQKGRWYLFIDHERGGDRRIATTAHKCIPTMKKAHIIEHDPYKTKSAFKTCLRVENGNCRDCNDPCPEGLQALMVLYNGGYIG